MTIRCDESMRRSKEKCFTPFNTKWRCDKDCTNCICALVKQYDGSWKHNRIKEVKNAETDYNRGNGNVNAE